MLHLNIKRLQWPEDYRPLPSPFTDEMLAMLDTVAFYTKDRTYWEPRNFRTVGDLVRYRICRARLGPTCNARRFDYFRSMSNLASVVMNCFDVPRQITATTKYPGLASFLADLEMYAERKHPLDHYRVT